MAELRINDIPVGSSGRRVEVTWQEGVARRVSVADVAALPGEGNRERIRWYLEEYAEFPAHPAPVIASEAEAELAQQGAALFRAVFAGPDAAGIWDRARDRLSEVRVEVDTDPGQGPGLAWELLRDPVRDQAVALAAGAFVRTHLQAAGHPSLPEPTGDRLRVLLVIARPGGRADVPFRSVASRLVRGGAQEMTGLDLDVLRPATFARLSQVLHAAHDAGRPYHVVHFDGHGTWLDLADLGIEPDSAGAGAGGAGAVLSPDMYAVSAAGPVRPGQHGYLLFEDPASQQSQQLAGERNQQLVDGPTLGRLMTDTGVPVLVLNACRSAYTEARDQPVEVEADGSGPAPGGPQADQADVENVLTGDVHARIRAYGSLAAEVADTGVPGVVAMRYNVYVVTAAQFMADLYAHLLAGRSLGQAATAARKALAANPVRRIGAVPVALQDWAVPVVYEAAPLVLLQPPERAAPVIKLTPAESRTGADAGAGGVPGPPDAGFFGRDETLLALDRAFDTAPVVLLHAFAGAGKSATAAEFARWYRVTGGLDHPEHPELGAGPVLWSSFEHHLTAAQVIGTAGDFFAGLLEASGIPWAAVSDRGQRRDLVLQVLAQVPVLWVWDNVEPVTGFPAGTPSDWAPAEQDDLVSLLRDLAQRTLCKVLLTSRRDERPWLGNLPARVQLPPMPIREGLQLAAELAARHGRALTTADWRPLLRYAAGNPLTITVAVGEALRENLSTTDDIHGFVGRLQTGEAQLEAGEDATLGRTRSLAASLSYGFAQAFTDAERAKLAVLHLFRDTADVDALCYMGNPDIAGEDAVPELAGLTREAAIALADRAAAIGLLESLGGGYYQIHPALPWYFATLFTATYGTSGQRGATRAARAYTRALSVLGEYYNREYGAGRGEQVMAALGAEEANLRNALALALMDQQLTDVIGCLQGLNILYDRTGRSGEWARLVEEVTPSFTDLGTDGPLPGLEHDWSIITDYRVRIARDALDWPAATRLQRAALAWQRQNAAEALAAPADGLAPLQRTQVRNLAVVLERLGGILREQDDAACLDSYQEALALYQRVGDQQGEAISANNLGIAYELVPGLRDLDRAERWYRRSLELRADEDRLGQARCLQNLGDIARARFDEALGNNADEAVLLAHLNSALRFHLQALDLIPLDNPTGLAVAHNQLGAIYSRVGDTRQALHHYQQSIKYEEVRGNIYGAGQTRFNVALLLGADDRPGDALHYARAALSDYQRVGPGAASAASKVQQLIERLQQQGQ